MSEKAERRELAITPTLLIALPGQLSRNTIGNMCKFPFNPG